MPARNNHSYIKFGFKGNPQTETGPCLPPYIREVTLDGGVSLGGGDLFELMAGELECSVAQMAAAYLGCIGAPDVAIEPSSC